jgi:DNA-binding transcriptional ArsR family regulator
VDDAARLAAALSPLRRRLLGELGRASDSAAGLARRLGLPRQRLNYHLRALERAGFLELGEERQRRGCVERALRVTARAFVIDPTLLGAPAADADAARDRFSSSYLIATAARLLGDAGALQRGAERAGKRLASLTLETELRFASAADRAAFATELGAALAALVAKYHDDSPGARAFRFVLAGHPVRKDAGVARQIPTTPKTPGTPRKTR